MWRSACRRRRTRSAATPTRWRRTSTRLGGFGIAAHPFSRRPELAWQDWNVPVDGIEWLNADSEWRDESRTALTRALLGYLTRPGGALASLLDRPEAALAKLDELAARRHVVAVAGHDAHGGFGEENGAQGRRLHLPSYEAAFRTFSVNVQVQRGAEGKGSRGRRGSARGDPAWPRLHGRRRHRITSRAGLQSHRRLRNRRPRRRAAGQRSRGEVPRPRRDASGRLARVAARRRRRQREPIEHRGVFDAGAGQLPGRGPRHRGAGNTADSLDREQPHLQVCGSRAAKRRRQRQRRRHRSGRSRQRSGASKKAEERRRRFPCRTLAWF